ncbi:MAG: transcription-repair coupling factor [Gammaproteobacteria bacterium]|nr:transcription-repair coupling factor [Gammaproteobacteria bacterium]
MPDIHSPLQPPSPVADRRNLWSGLYGQPALAAAAAMAICATARQHAGLTVVICTSAQQASMLERDCLLLRDDDSLPVLHFPDWETLPYDLFSPHPDIISARLATLASLPDTQRGLLIVPVSTLLQRLAPIEFIRGHSLQISVGETLPMLAFRENLINTGYEPVDAVYQSGQFAQRGALIDVFPAGIDLPLRIEWLDDDIDSLRSFDPETQRSLQAMTSVRLLPSREYPFTPESSEQFRQRFRQRFSLDMRHCTIYQDLRKGYHPQGLEYFLPLFFEHTSSLFDYLGPQPQLILQPGIEDTAAQFLQHVDERHEQRRHDIQRPILTPAELFISLPELQPWLQRRGSIELLAEPSARSGQHIALAQFDVKPAPELDLHSSHAEHSLSHLAEHYPGRILLAADSAGRREVLSESLAAFRLRPRHLPDWHAFRASPDVPLAVVDLPLSDGLELPQEQLLILTESQLFKGRVRQKQRRPGERDPAAVIRGLADLQVGALVVHEEQGIGRYQGLSVLEVAGMQGEYLTLEYAEGDKLYVPISDLQLITRYIGGDQDSTALHRLGSDRWQKTRRKAARKIRDAAAELLDIYARREAASGTAMTLDRKLYTEFAGAFPFEETADQQTAIDAVIADMTSPRIMDRVVCGDVGFGKTEVALRAAFVAVQSGHQVALLCPTTLLARQHFNVFSDRFADWPVKIGLLSRTRSARESRELLDALAAGKLDIIIGTHKLLQDNIGFANLGLLIVDEEQRFGVRHKEKLKTLRAEVDMLTLTATPIPRTLGMAMSGIRDLSIIATPPARRIAVKTTVTQWDDSLISDAIERELQRGGQVYFVHNKVRTIASMATQLGRLFPQESIAIAHGQMPQPELERVMRDFYARRFSILVCTTIIENGIDVASANTILINKADHFGLAQLHQLRGRVGRSHHRAFAYLLIADWQNITADAQKRLQAISELEDLGAGFALSTHDMEIRGAGELLGEEQSGQMHAIGFELHLQMLEQAVAALRAGEEPDLSQPMLRTGTVELHLPAFIPDDYLPDVPMRLTLYKRISMASDNEALRQLQIELIDRFGLLPQATKNLIAISNLKLQAKQLGLARIDFGPGGGWIDFSEQPRIDSAKLIAKVQYQADEFKLQGQQRLSLKALLDDDQQRLLYIRQLLQDLKPDPANQPDARKSSGEQQQHDRH